LGDGAQGDNDWGGPSKYWTNINKTKFVVAFVEASVSDSTQIADLTLEIEILVEL